MSRPNVLLLIADDHQADAIGALGHPVVRTPTLDALVRAGTACTRVGIMGSLMAAVCAPSRASLLTGRSALRADADPRLIPGPDYEVALPPDAPTLSQWLGAAGYQTFFTGKWHNDLPALLRSFEAGDAIFHGGMCAHERVPVRTLEEVRRGVPPRAGRQFSSELFCGAAENFLRRRDARPFFACVALTSPHDPRTPPPPFRDLYDPATLPLPASFAPEHAFDNGELDIRDEQLAARPRDPAEVRRHLAQYYGMISHHDACLGRLLDTLRETGGEESTLVVYVSDHGLALGRHGLMGKQNLYEHSVRVPALLRGPGVPRGHRCDALAYAFDLFATICDLTGVAPPGGIDSRSLRPAIEQRGPARTELGSLYMDRQRAFTTERHKIIVYQVHGRQRVQLFDLRADPDEAVDLAGTEAAGELVPGMLRRLERWQQTVGDRWMKLAPPGSGYGTAA